MTDDADDVDELTSDDLRKSVADGVSPNLLALTAPDFALAIEAYSYDFRDRGVTARGAMDEADSDERAAYWKGRFDAYSTVRGELVAALLRHEKIDRYPMTDDELAPETGESDE